jgi:hypothetical protein
MVSALSNLDEGSNPSRPSNIWAYSSTAERRYLNLADILNVVVLLNVEGGGIEDTIYLPRF